MLYEQSWKQDIPAPKLCLYRVSSYSSVSSYRVSSSSVSSNAVNYNYRIRISCSAVSSSVSTTARRERNCERHSSSSYEHEN